MQGLTIASDLPFGWRVCALLAFLGGTLLLDRLNPPGERHRAGEYGFLLAAGVLGALLGVAVDAVTLRISPDYFVDGKGITAGGGFTWRVLSLGARAGLSAGILGGALVLFANPLPSRALRLVRHLWIPPLLAVGGGVLLAVLQAVAAPLPSPVPEGWLDADAARACALVWALHWGVYGGALAGVGWFVWIVRTGSSGTGSSDTG